MTSVRTERESVPADDGESDLAASIHETTNALTVILGWIARAEQDRHDPHAVSRALARAADHARATRNAMRRSIGANVPQAHPERAAVLARNVLDDLAVEAAGASVRLDHDIAAAAAEAVVGAPHAVWRVLTNLLLNAIAFSPPGKVVRLTVAVASACDDDAPMVRFDVTDEGPGVPPALRDVVFAGGHSERPGGTGIGLRHARELAQQHGGSLELAPPGAGGATLTLLWPQASLGAPRVWRPKAMRAVDRLDGMRVLLLEDDPAVVELLELSLGARGAELTTVQTRGGLHSALATDAPYDAMLVDLSPLDGQLDEAVDLARRSRPGIGVLVISGSVSVQPRPDVTWLRKPFEPGELVQAIVRERKYLTSTP